MTDEERAALWAKWEHELEVKELYLEFIRAHPDPPPPPRSTQRPPNPSRPSRWL